MVSLYRLLGVATPFDPTARFTSSWFLPTTILAIIRLLFSLYAFATIFVILGLDTRTAAGQSFSYFTSLAYWGLAFYLLFAGLHTLIYAHREKGTTEFHASWLHGWPRPLQALHSMLYSSIVVLPFIVTITFWAILYKGPFFPEQFPRWSNISQHAMNSGFALFEIVVPRTDPPPALHVVVIVVVLGLYLALAYLTHTTQGFYTYSFLDYDTQGSTKTAIYCVVIAAAGIIIFAIVWALIWLRRRITEGPTGKRVTDVEEERAAMVMADYPKQTNF